MRRKGDERPLDTEPRCLVGAGSSEEIGQCLTEVQGAVSIRRGDEQSVRESRIEEARLAERRDGVEHLMGELVARAVGHSRRGGVEERLLVS